MAKEDPTSLHFVKQSPGKVDPADQEVGERLRVARQRFGLSQRELARRAGMTNGSISLIEQGRVSPSVGSLRRLTGALSMTLAEFFVFEVDTAAHSPFFKADTLAEIGSGRVSLRLVGKRAGSTLQVLHERYAPGADTGEDFLSHAGEEAGVVTRGQILVTVGGEEQLLGPGDAYAFESRIPHRFRNLSDEECEIVSAATEPSL